MLASTVTGLNNSTKLIFPMVEVQTGCSSFRQKIRLNSVNKPKIHSPNLYTSSSIIFIAINNIISNIRASFATFYLTNFTLKHMDYSAKYWNNNMLNNIHFFLPEINRKSLDRAYFKTLFNVVRFSHSSTFWKISRLL